MAAKDTTAIIMELVQRIAILEEKVANQSHFRKDSRSSERFDITYAKMHDISERSFNQFKILSTLILFVLVVLGVGVYIK